MARKSISLIVVLVLILGTMPMQPVAMACGPYLVEAVFTDMKAPDFDYGEFVQGKLGILQPSYYDMFLFAAYRNLSGAPFTKAEISSLSATLGINPTMATTDRERHSADPGQQSEETRWHLAAGETDWERKNYPDVQGVIRSESRDGNYIEYYNCLPDAFKMAQERLQQHRQQFGAGSPAVNSWLEAQKQVFSNCGAPYQYNKPPHPAVIPVSAQDADPPVIRADRQYQIAAAHFYAGEFDTAAAQFGEIAKTGDSPWREIARYLQARTLIRKGTIGDGKGNPDEDSLLAAEKIMREVAADPKQEAIKKAAMRRLDFLSARLHPEERRIELAPKLTRPGGSTNFDQDKSDYFWLLNRQGYTLGTKDDLTDWISAMKLKTAASTEEAAAQWKKTKSLPWLVAAICKIDATRPEAGDLLKAAQQVPSNSPAHTTIFFHALRLKAEAAKDPSSVVLEIDRILASEFKDMPVSAKNQFLALRMSLAKNFEEFLRFSPRIPAGVAYTYGIDDDKSLISPLGADKKNLPSRFDADAAIVLSERLPLSMIATASKSDKLPPELQRMVTLAAWTRAVVLKNDSISQELAPRVMQLAPELKPALESYLTAKTPDERAFAAAYAILRSPGLRPFIDSGQGRDTPTDQLDNLHDNWWCSFATNSNAQPAPGNYSQYPWKTIPSSLRQIYAEGKLPAIQFLTSEESRQGASEFESLSKLAPAPDWLGSETIAFAAGHPDDPRMPEALHLVVRATRFGCTGDGSGRVSKAAFELLHKKYPESNWAKQTPYWFR